MLAIIVPALALSGCKEKKSSRDKDDDSSSSSSESVEEEKKTDISGKYMLDEESVRMLFANDAESDNSEMNFSCEMTLYDDNELQLTFMIDASEYIEDIENTMNYYFEVSGKGIWEYDKKDRILTTDIRTADISDFTVSFLEDNELTDAFIAECGGMDGVEKTMKEAVNEGFPPNEICVEQEFRITELTDDGFYAKTTSGKIQKVRFVKVD